MNPLTVGDFQQYFRELHGEPPFDDDHSRPPYDWQTRLVEKAIAGNWPKIIDLPTGSGKTACIDIAVFALACQASWPKIKRSAARRIFFCVNRRVIVDEAYQRARRIAEKLHDAEEGRLNAPVLVRVAQALRLISTLRRKSAPPLDVLELRGGIYRDNNWARSATQPMIVCTTLDQLGSRLLFRGYGVSPNAAPIQASLIAYDSLLLLDEAHISQPFRQTLDFVRCYLDPQRWAKQPIGVLPMTVVPMTATPGNSNDTEVIRLEPADRENLGLDNRLKASKPAKLLSVSDIVQSAVTEAGRLAGHVPTAVGILVNRVATARAIYDELREKHQGTVVELVIGSMRPIDRDRQADRLRSIIGPDRPEVTTQTSFVVATQCLEVGADYDFDALVTECASLDALRQRFGRLNRGGRDIEAQAVILIESKQVKEESQLDNDKPLDPIYGNALSRTWNWLTEHAEVLLGEPEAGATATRRRRSAAPAVAEVRRVDFGIDAFTATLREHGEDGRIPENLLPPSAFQNAPVMLPAYIDFWCQTSPRLTPDPEVSLFIHGPQAGEPDVQVCWRADLNEDYFEKEKRWCDVVGLLPPTSAECMSVPISRLRRWLTNDSGNADQSDLLGTQDHVTASDESKKAKEQGKQLNESRAGVLWRGASEGKSRIIKSPQELRPGDTLVLPATAQGWNELGHAPEATVETIDLAETAFLMARDRAVLRLHPTLKPRMPDSPTTTELLDRISNSEEALSQTELRRLLRQIADNLAPDRGDLANTCNFLAMPRFGLIRESYPDERGFVLTTRRRVQSVTSWYVPVDEGEDERSRTLRESPVSLGNHTRHVREEVLRTVGGLPLDELSDAYCLAADLHDLGKADERFQAMLRRTDRTDAWLFAGMDSALLAKSDAMPQTPQQRRQARERAGLPEGFRHEMLSVQIVEHGKLITHDDRFQELILHLIASHHGYARPFAPVVVDTELPDVTVNGVTLSGSARSEVPPYRIDSGIAERFWKLTRYYGWWGLAYLEAVLRLADQQASADEDAGVFDADTSSVEPAEAAT